MIQSKLQRHMAMVTVPEEAITNSVAVMCGFVSRTLSSAALPLCPSPLIF